MYSDGEQGGVYLIQNKRWTFHNSDSEAESDQGRVLVDPGDDNPAVVNQDDDDSDSADDPPRNVLQADGNDDPDSLTPSPETSPENQAPLLNTGARSKTDVRLNYGGYLSTSSPDISPHRTVSKAETESMEWDALGTHFDTPPRHLQHPTSYSFDLDRPANLEFILPVSSLPELSTQPDREINLDRATNLQLRLPISSTPNSPRRPRVSHCRKSLPLETEASGKSSTPKFLSRLNPFRKKSPEE